MKTSLQLVTEVYADLALATDMGHLQHLGLEMQPFTGLDASGRPRFVVNLPMSAPAFCAWGAQTFSIIVPWDAMGNRTHLGESTSVVEIAPLRYGGALFDSPYFVEERGEGGLVHPMLRGDQIKRFGYPQQMANFHRWIVEFCNKGRDDEEEDSVVR